MTFTSPTAGTVTGHASVTVSIGGIDVSRETDDVAPNSDDAVKVFVAGSILWRKVDNALELQGGATFEVCKTNDYILPDGGIDPTLLDPPECFDVVDNGPKDGNALDGVFLVSGLSLGRYTVQETIAPDGFVADPDTVTVDLIPGDTEASIDDAFVNSREVLKITGFGYTNEAAGTPTSGVVTGTTTFTVDLHNYGTADANLTNSSLVVTTDAATGTVVCDGSPDANTLDLEGETVSAGGSAGPFTLACDYTDLDDGDTITATLVVKSTTNNTEREASGSPATITLTIEAGSGEAAPRAPIATARGGPGSTSRGLRHARHVSRCAPCWLSGGIGERQSVNSTTHPCTNARNLGASRRPVPMSPLDPVLSGRQTSRSERRRGPPSLGSDVGRLDESPLHARPRPVPDAR